MTVVPHPPYSPDLAPCDFFLFPKMKMKLKGRRFQTLEETEAESQAVLNTLRENDSQECFKKWQHRWNCCSSTNPCNCTSTICSFIDICILTFTINVSAILLVHLFVRSQSVHRFFHVCPSTPQNIPLIRDTKRCFTDRG